MVKNNTGETFLIDETLYFPGEEIPDQLAKKHGMYNRLIEEDEELKSIMENPPGLPAFINAEHPKKQKEGGEEVVSEGTTEQETESEQSSEETTSSEDGGESEPTPPPTTKSRRK